MAGGASGEPFLILSAPLVLCLWRIVMTNTADGVRKVAESVAAGYGPDIFSGAGSINQMTNTVPSILKVIWLMDTYWHQVCQ